MPRHKHGLSCLGKNGALICDGPRVPGDFIAEEFRAEKRREKRGLPRKWSRAQTIAIGLSRAEKSGVVPERCKYRVTVGAQKIAGYGTVAIKSRCVKRAGHRGGHLPSKASRN